MVLILALQIPVWIAVARVGARSASTSGQTWWQRNRTSVALSNVGLATAVWMVRLALGDIAGPSTLTMPW